MMFDIPAISPHLSSVRLTNHMPLLRCSEQVPEYCPGPEGLLSAGDLQYTPLSDPTERAAEQSEAPPPTLVPAQDPLRCFANSTYC